MNNHKGFTLIETAIVLLIIGLLIGGLLPVLTNQIESKRLADVNSQLTEIRQAIIGFAQANGRLPCPDCRIAGCTGGTTNDGNEDVNGAACRVDYGNLPWNTLGMSAAQGDPWGTRFGYYADPSYVNSATLSLSSMDSSGNVVDHLSGTPLTNNAVAIILSYGKNQAGGTHINTAAGSTATMTGSPAAGADEIENNDADNNFVAGDSTTSGVASGQFDDIVIWLSPNVFNYHMIQAGQLP